ncbi:AraC family transcriptional regulator [Paenibacillus humicola]|uniref:AraC family transcriptional regulator n=1 Tax=Paenibacillus humicola TaxID=3110540 RepID=UPI00237A4D7B|nr:AraC family transcriptional regulator [Paenibacillus humicola]
MDHYQISIGSNPLPARGELSVLFSGEGKPYPLHRIGPVVHNYYLVHTVLSGRGTFEIDGKTYECGRGDTFFIFPDILFTYTADSDEPWQYRWIAFQGETAEGLLAGMGITPRHPVIHAADTRRLARLYRSVKLALERTEYPELADLEAGGLLRVMLKEYGMINAGRMTPQAQMPVPDIERQINQAIRMLSYQYSDRFSIEDLARKLGYHRTHLSKMFKQATGLSPMQFLLKVRMVRARELLSGSKYLSIDQVASSVGYPDALYFSKQFRKTHGISPTEYRSRNRPNSL